MKQTLKLSIIQSALIWEDPEENRKVFELKIKELKDTDIIVLPEMFTTGFTMNPREVAETMGGESIRWMREKARENDVVLMGSLIIKENDRYFNRFIITFPDGSLKYSDKRHLFSFAGEDAVYTAGSKPLTITWKGFKILPLICYDLRFPVWARNTENIDLILYVANWPAPRIKAWDILLKARAIENMCYVVGVNRVGVDENGHNYPGHSVIIDAFGEEILGFQEGKEGSGTIVLDHKKLDNIRNKFRFLNDRDSFKIL